MIQQLSTNYTAHQRTFNLVKRDENKAMYQSEDGVIEIFKIKVLPAAEIYGKSYPEREGFPSDEDFGRIAWCYGSNTEAAERKYNSL